MKKIILSVLTTSMLLSTSAFAATSAHANNTKDKAITSFQQGGMIHICTQDPRG